MKFLEALRIGLTVLDLAARAEKALGGEVATVNWTLTVRKVRLKLRGVLSAERAE